MMAMMSSWCPDDDNRTPYKPPAPPPPRPRRPTPASSLASLAAVVVVVVVVAGLAGPVEAGLMDFSAPEVIQYGTCAQPKDQQPFDFRQFNGLWYQVEMVPNSYMEPKQCITLHFDWNGEAYNVTTVGLNEYNEVVYQDAIITREQPKDLASRPYLKIRAAGVPPVPYHVVKTDYHNFACVYSCFELFALMFEAFSVLSRHAVLDEATQQACHQAFAALDVDVTRLQPVRQDGLCLLEGLEGSGEAPHWDEDEEHEDGNALAALTSEEVNPNASSASNRRSDPTVQEEEVEEGETLMEEEEEEVQEGEEDAGGAEAEETEGTLASETSSFTKLKLATLRNQTDGVIQERPNGTSGVSDLEGKKPRKGHRRKKMKGVRRRKKGEGKEEEKTPPTTSRNEDFYLDEIHLDSLYYPMPEEERGGGGGGGDERDRASLSTHDHDGAGGVAASSPLLLLALLTLALCARVPPAP